MSAEIRTWFEDYNKQLRAGRRAASLLTVLRARGVAVPEVARERILAQKDPDRLERWLEKAVVAASVGEVHDDPSPASARGSETHRPPCGTPESVPRPARDPPSTITTPRGLAPEGHRAILGTYPRSSRASLEHGTRFANYTLLRLLGVGRFAEVYEVISARRGAAGGRFKVPLPSDVMAAKAQVRLRPGGRGPRLDRERPRGALLRGGRRAGAGVDIEMELVGGTDLARILRPGPAAAGAGGAPRAPGVRGRRGGARPRDLAPRSRAGEHPRHRGRRHRQGGGLRIGQARQPQRADDDGPERQLGAVEGARVHQHQGRPARERRVLDGARPLRGPDGHTPDRAATHDDVRHRPAPPLPRAAAAGCAGARIPTDLSDLVQRTLSKDPGRRGSMRDLADDLAVVLHPLQARRRAVAVGVPLPNREIGLAQTERMPAVGETEARGVVLPPAGARVASGPIPRRCDRRGNRPQRRCRWRRWTRRRIDVRRRPPSPSRAPASARRRPRSGGRCGPRSAWPVVLQRWARRGLQAGRRGLQDGRAEPTGRHPRPGAPAPTAPAPRAPGKRKPWPAPAP